MLSVKGITKKFLCVHYDMPTHDAHNLFDYYTGHYKLMYTSFKTSVRVKLIVQISQRKPSKKIIRKK